jgi:hypothetical protein
MSYQIDPGYRQPRTARKVAFRVFPAFFTFLLFSMLQTSQLIAQSIPLGDREKVLTIRVYNSAGEPGNLREITLSIKDLEKFPLVSVRTETQWTDGVLHFRGPLMRDLLNDVGAAGDLIQVNGLDGRSVVIPREDIEKYDVIIACQVDGNYFSVRERGPLWIIYPWSNNPEIQSAAYYDRGIYHLSSLNVAYQ